MNSTLQQGENLAASVQKTPHRITLDDLRSKVAKVEYINPQVMPHLTICLLVLQNGFSLVGKSAPADPANFDAIAGQKFAFEDALRQLWPLEGYLLRERLAGQ
ncbi:hypothetical protein MASR2M74_03050 [Paracoccaceae bacterium]